MSTACPQGPSRRIPRAVLFLVGCVAIAADPAVAAPPPTIDIRGLERLARQAGLRVIDGERLTLVTDRPRRDGDGVDELPGIFAEAFERWCRHYDVAAEEAEGWRAFGCLMGDRERFRQAGLLPADGSVPDFANGFCDRNRFWLDDQANPAYRRHLLLHEGVHAFTLTLRALDTPTWYTEGIAELLATHRLEDGHFVPTPIPRRADDVEQLGRIEALRRLRAAGNAPGLADVFATPPSPRHDLPAYAASWAATAMLASHPAHAPSFGAVEKGPLDRRLTARLADQPGWDADRAARDFDAFTDDVDHGYDFTRSAIDWAPGRPLRSPQRVVVKADRGWQPSGWTLAPGTPVDLRATGRCRIGSAGAIELESEPDGISLRWYRGRPAGRLVAAQWFTPPAGGRPRFEVIGEGASARLAPVAAGMLFLRINEPPGDLADNEGTFEVEIAPAR